MSDKRKSNYVTRAAILVAAGLVVRLIGFLYKLPLTSLIGDRGNGIYNTGYQLYMLFLIISSAGLPAAISKLVSERLELRQFRNAHQVFRISLTSAGIMGLSCSLILWLGAGGFASLAGNPDSYWSIVMLSPTIFIVALMSAFRGYFQGMSNTLPTAVSQVIEQILNAVFSVWLAFVFINKGIEYGAAGGTAGTGVGALGGLAVVAGIYFLVQPVVLKRVRSDKASKSYESISEIALVLFKTAAPIIIGTAIFSITNLIDVKMVMERLMEGAKFTEERATELYGQLTGKYVSITTLPVAISSAMATAAIPAIAASMAAKNINDAKQKVNTMFRIAMTLSVPSAVGIGVLGKQIIALLFPSYPMGGELLNIGFASIIFLATAQLCAGILQSLGKVHIPVYAALAGAIIKIPLNYFLIAIPGINVKGAVISSIACYAVVSGINLCALARLTGIVPDLIGGLVKPLIAAGVMGLASYVFYHFFYTIKDNNTFAALMAIAVGIAVYFAVMLLIKGVDRNDLRSAPMGRKLEMIFDRFL